VVAQIVPVSVLEMPEFQRAAAGLLSEEEVFEAISSIALEPEAGDVMPGTGGLRKIRIPLRGRGKSGGARVVYGYFGADLPVFVFSCFPKNQKADLTQAEKNTLRKRIPVLLEEYRNGVAIRAQARRQASGR
jgi:hypothetical protein